MGRKSKRVIARILAVLMAFTLLPFDLWGSANVVMAEEASETYTEEATDEEDDSRVTENVTDAQENVEAAENVTDTQEEKADDALTEDVTDAKEDSVSVIEEEKVADEKDGENKESEKNSIGTDNKAILNAEYVHNFTVDGVTSRGIFEISGTTGDSKGVYTDKDGNLLSFTKGLKTNSSGSVTVKVPTSGTLILVKTTSDTRTISVGGQALSCDANGVIEVTVNAGNCEIKKGSGESKIFYIAFIPDGSSEPEKETVAIPTANPANGAEVKIGEIIELTCGTPDAEIYYTINGSNEALYTDDGITIESGMEDNDNKITITAYGKKDGYTNSDLLTLTYTLSTEAGENQLEMPTADPEPGAVARGTTVTLSAETDASIYYTTDGTKPDTDSTLFDEANPIEITEELTIKAIAVKEGFTTSFPASFTYTIKKPTIKIHDDSLSKSVISKVELNGDVTFTNGTKEVFDIGLKVLESTNPDNDVKLVAEGLKENGGEIIYYDFSLVNNESTSDTVSIADDTEGTIKIKMPYSIASNADKRNGIAVVNATTGEIETNKDSSGFVFDADSIGSYAVVINPAAETGDLVILESAGYEEGAYAEWEAVEDADGYMAYVASSDGEFTRIDDELIREYKDYWRVDTVGLAKGTYYIKINAVVLDEKKETATVISSNTTDALKVTNYDRSGFAFSDKSPIGTASGAYNDDGTLKEGAQVIYVTAETAKTVTAIVHTDGKENTYTGLQTILDAKQKKGTSDDILDIRIIGAVNYEDLDKISSTAEGIQIKGNAARTPMNITLEGIGEDAVVKGFGFLIRNCANIEFRNFGILDFMDDGVSVDTDNCNLWFHDLDLFYGQAGGDSDQKKGDGTIDIKLSQYCTVSYNHFWDSGKSCLIDAGIKETNYADYLTYHHNWFDHSDSRHPRIRNGHNFHIYNNYYDGNSKYGVGSTTGSCAFVEANYFENCNYPMMISQQGTDALGTGTFSKEAGGMIKAYANYIEGAKSYLPYSSTNKTEFDAYEVSDASEQVPSSVTTKAGATYNNFDTSEVMYDYVADTAADAKENVKQYAGRLNGGDLKWTFADSENTNYAVIPELKSLVENYKTSVKSISGGIKGDPVVVDDDTTPPGPGDDNFETVSAPKASTPTNTEVEKGTKIALASDTTGAEIYYTINGGTPTKNSIHYTDAIEITGTTTIRAIAVLGNEYSEVSIFKYTVPGEVGGDNPGGDDSGGDNSGDNDQPANTKIVTYEFNPQSANMGAGEMPAADTKYGTDGYFTIGNAESKGKIATTNTSAPNPSKSSVTKYGVRYQFGGTAATAEDPKAIRFTTANKARVSVGAHRTNDNERNLYLDTDENVKVLTRTATEYTFDIVEAGSHSIYAKDGDIAILYVFVEEFVPITTEPGDKIEVKEPYPTIGQGQVPKGTSVELKCDTAGAKIYYTTDETDPTEESTVYTSPIPLGDEAKKVVIKAIAVKDNEKSKVAVLEYTVSADMDPDTFVSAPVSDVTQGEVSKGTKITLTSATADAKIYYTTDGTIPTPKDELLYKDFIVVNETVTIKAIAVKGENKSSVSGFAYTVSTGTSGGDTQIVEAPEAIPGNGAQFSSAGGSVELKCDTEGAVIYYTTSSTEGGLTDPADKENTKRKEYRNTPILIKEETYIWAVAVKDDIVSEALKCHYIVLPEGAVVQPIASPGSSEVTSGTKVKLSAAEPVDNIYYTMGSTPADTADPTLENSGRKVYDDKTQIVITEAVIIKAVAQKGGKYSEVATFIYTIASGGTEDPDDPAPEVKTIKLEECEITVPAIIRNTSKKADAKQPSVTYVTYKYTDESGEEKHVKFAEGGYLDYKAEWNGPVEGKENTYSVTLTGLGREEDQFKIDTASTITKEYKVIDKPGRSSAVKVIDISKAKVSLAAADIKNVVYTGYAIEPKLDYAKDKDDLEGKLNIAYKNNINAGKATVIISAKPELNNENTIYIGSKTLTFNIKKAALNKDNAKATAKVSWDESFSMTSGHDYTGTPIIVKGLKVESGKGRILGLNTDYTVTYKNNASAGKATVTVKGIGSNLSGSWTQNFTINPIDLNTLTFNKEINLPYSPKGAKLMSITAKNAAGIVYTLKEGVDFTAKYTYASKTKEAGSKVMVSISGKGACTGRDIEIGELEIVKADFAECISVPEDIAVDGKDLTKELTKAIVVTDASGVKLSVKKDYTIGTPDQETKEVVLNPVDTKNYENACTVQYRVATNLAKDKGFVFDKNKEKTKPLAYDGRNPVSLTADIINEYVGPAYKLGTNIEIVQGTYKNNTKKGTAQVTVRGKAGVDGGFYGQKVLKFKIVEK